MCDMPKVWSEENVKKSRKDHKCCECGGVIPKGSPYNKCSGVWDDTWDVYRTCVSCRTIRSWYATEFPNDDYPGRYMFRELWSNLDESITYDWEDPLLVNLMHTMIYTGGMKECTPSLYFRYISRLYENQPYEVIKFLYPHGHLKQLQAGSNEWRKILAVEDIPSVWKDPDKSVLCVASVPAFDITAVIPDQKTLDIFLNPMDIRPKTFVLIHKNMVKYINKEQTQYALDVNSLKVWIQKPDDVKMMYKGCAITPVFTL